MKKAYGSVLGTALFAVFLFNSTAFAAEVEPWFVEEVKNNEAVLEPGTTTYCNKNFAVENMGSEMAEVQVILGNGANYAHDMLEPGSTKGYSLTSDYPLAGGWEETKGIRIDEARIINNTGGESKIKVHCK
ncbi:MAG: hypothetical protein NPINA01_04340 [Nitrospinaceae bacterium]|nr:MAG: hypothetical protein NPINA01_04340 [Nitrospinaceae bacterium]